MRKSAPQEPLRFTLLICLHVWMFVKTGPIRNLRLFETHTQLNLIDVDEEHRKKKNVSKREDIRKCGQLNYTKLARM